MTPAPDPAPAADPAGEAGFAPPAYPYDRLNALQARAEQRFGLGTGTIDTAGIVDCSIGTPCDPPPTSVLEAMAASNAERGYPASAGSAAYRRAATAWLARRFDVAVDADAELAACVGTKEFVASTPHYLRLRTPRRDTVLYPAVSYPTYAMGAELAACRAVPVGELDGGGLDLASIEPDDVKRALMLWTNSPSNPTGRLTDLAVVADWGRAHHVPVFSDECYAEFTWEGRPATVLAGGLSGVVAVHSLSKRSNLAGIRAGFFAGDPTLVAYLRDVRRHAGLMVPGPVQAGGAVALADDAHVTEQRHRYRERLVFVQQLLDGVGLTAPMPAGGFYLWVPVPPVMAGAGWALTEHLALTAGLLVSPGELYGPDGAGFVRLAVVQPMERLAVVGERLLQQPSILAG